MKPQEMAHLRAELRAVVAENAEEIGLRREAAPDMVERLLRAGATFMGDRVVMPDGRDPATYAKDVIRPGFDGLQSEHLFESAPTPAPQPKAKPPAAAPADVSTPTAAARTRKGRIDAVTAKLAAANGEPS